MMLKFRIVAAVVAFAMLAQVPAMALAGTQQNPSQQASVKVATSATPLTASEMARYGQLQADAQQTGVLDNEKGGADATTWTIVGIVVVVCIGVGLGVAIANGK